MDMGLEAPWVGKTPEEYEDHYYLDKLKELEWNEEHGIEEDYDYE